MLDSVLGWESISEQYYYSHGTYILLDQLCDLTYKLVWEEN